MTAKGVVISRNILAYQTSRASLKVINIDNVCVIITIVSAKQLYNGRVKLFNEIEPVHLLVHFPFCSGF